MITNSELKAILDNFETTVLEPLKKYKGGDEDITEYLGYNILGASLFKFKFAGQYVDEAELERTLFFNVCINLRNIRYESGVDQKAAIPARLPEAKKVALRLSYLIWYVVEELEDFFESNREESNLICASKSNRMDVLIMPERPDFKYNIHR